MGTNNLTAQTNNYFDEQKIKYNEQIIIYKEQKYNAEEIDLVIFQYLRSIQKNGSVKARAGAVQRGLAGMGRRGTCVRV